MTNHTMGFHPAMHPLLRDGRKTQTRRVVKDDVLAALEHLDSRIVDGHLELMTEVVEIGYDYPEEVELWHRIPCPYEIGDTITVEGTDIRLTVTAIRCERLNDISDEDCEAEGVEYEPAGYSHYHALSQDAFNEAPEAFADLWSCIYPEGPKSWTANPVVWVVEFERLEKEDEN